MPPNNLHPDRAADIATVQGYRSIEALIPQQIGVRRTLPMALEEAWQLLMSPTGVRLRLGHVARVEFEKGARYSSKDGEKGEVRVFDPHQHLRITWQPKGWARPSTIQIRVFPNGLKTTIAFHQE